ncbi:LANO_0G08548g1_1 [Lachancea nothofagi CBS 11611]|uniref:Eukaryotic peptide chain release factor GTP-binding subunit n=1 Tax=Lachancea nothofagi CBS 11611 TaxID=1266666 RepID=A0A1G4KI59_9SACH|nr:LANO_0G08548g1_1 [Lachancea nothofagi CBS 11611]
MSEQGQDQSQNQQQGFYNQYYQNAGQQQAGFQPQGNDYQQYYQGYGQNYNQNDQAYQTYNQDTQGQQGYQGYNANYQNNNQGGRGGFKNNRGGYKNYNQQGYQSYNQGYSGYDGAQSYQSLDQQPASQGMTLQDFQNQKSTNLNKPVATTFAPSTATPTSTPAAKPKKTLKLASSSGIKLVGATKKPEVVKKEEVNKDEAQKTENKVEDSQVEAQGNSKQSEAKCAQDSLPKVEKLKISDDKSTKKATEATNASSAAAATSAEALIKEQEDEVDEEIVNDMFGGKDHMSIIFMGHVDAGKSTMGGNLLYLTGSVDKRTVDKYEREAKEAGRQGWYLSWVMDTNKEERSDGKTIEVGRAYFETEKRRYTILDAPGHKMYVSEMIGGASQADVGVLVISARKGEYETGFEKGGQTREHALLAKTQGVNKMIVVVNKMDDPTVAWDKERYDLCVKNISVFLKAIGYNIKQEVVFMPVSGYTGAGLKARVDPKDCPWYTGPSLLEYLDGMTHVDRRINAPFMLPIASKMKDLGTIVEGKIASGHIKKNTSTLLMPNRIPVEIVNIYNETESEVDMAICGEQVRLKIKGVEEEDISAGFVLTSPKNPVKNVTKFVAQIAIVELKSIISAGFSCVMHVHTAIEEVTITKLLHKLEMGSNRKSKKPPAFAKKGMKIIAVLEAEEPVCVETYQDYPQLGRFTLRDQGTTIAIGKIIKIAE